MIRDQFWLTDEQFSKIEPHLPTDTRGKARVDDRRIISGIVHVLKPGGRWIDAPPEYGPRKTLYNRYVRWAAEPAHSQHLSATPAVGAIRQFIGPISNVCSGSIYDVRPDCFKWGEISS